jgi:iron complex transport system permease protein
MVKQYVSTVSGVILVAGDKNREIYAKITGHKKAVNLFLIAAVFVSAYLALMAGAADITTGQLIPALLGRGNESTVMVMRNLRLPRVAAAIIAGAGLALAGCVMQSILQNPMASPTTLGIANAAAFGANFAIIIVGAGSIISSGTGEIVIDNPYIVTIFALFFSLMSAVLIIILARTRNFSPEGIVLSGIALNSLFSAGTMIIQYFAVDTTRVAAVLFWTFGDLGRVSWHEISIMTVLFIAGAIYFAMNSWNYNALDNGEETAISLGIKITRIRLTSMFTAALITAVMVSFLGMISFIGLAAPQIARRIVGDDKKYLLPASSLLGAVLLLLSDAAARSLISPQTLPVGAVTAFLGAPVFLFILAKGKGGTR